MWRRLIGRLRSERGTAVLLALGFLVFLLALGGFAIDLAYQMTAIGELQRSMEAASLAGAGKLGFDDSVFPTVRAWAQQYAGLNPHHKVPDGQINLDPNTGNDPAGDIVLGIWDGNARTFTPSLDGTMVNAVRCQWQTTVPTMFLSVLGIQTLPVSAQAIAFANPPQNPPPDACLFPMGVGSCPFLGPTSQGCGVPITFITSSGKDDGAGCLAPPCDNTAAWVNLDGGSANADYLKKAIADAAAGGCATSPLQTGDSLETNNGMVQSVMSDLEDVFVNKWASSEIHEVTDKDGNVVYSGKGWKVYIPVIETACPAGAISGSRQIVGWTELVMTQVINGGDCAVENHYPGNQWDPIGNTPNCTGENVPQNSGSLRAIFGYFSCVLIPSNPVPTPVPRTALGTRLRLVKTY